jgi:hypothetical protein
MTKFLPSPAVPLMLCGLLLLDACKRKSEASSEKSETSSEKSETSSATAVGGPSRGADGNGGNAPAVVIRSEDEICKLLTDEEVGVEMKQPVTGRRMPSSGQYSAPSCGWLTSDAPDSPGFLLTLFFHPDSPDGPSNFTRKVKDVCNVPTYEGNKPPVQEQQRAIEGLGDEATLCRKLLVRKGNNFFFIGRQKGDPAVPWQDVARRLAAKVVSRLP